MIRVIFSFLLAISAALRGEPASAQQGGPQPVVVAEVRREPIVAEKSFVGTVEPRRESTIGSAVDGRVIELVAREGDFLKEGEPLARLRTTTIELELAAARAELRLREETLRELQNGSLPEEIEQARARMSAAEADKAYQESNLKRLLQLRASGRSTVTEDTVELAQAQTENARQSLLEATAAFELARKGPRAERIAQSQASVDFQKQQVLRLEDQLDKHTIRAPYDGYVTERLCEAGQWVKQGDPVVSMIDLRVVDVVVDLPELYISDVRTGAPVRVQFDALADTEPIAAAVSRVVPRGQRQGRTFPVRIELENSMDDGARPVLKAGMLAHVAMPLGAPREALVVPKDALVLGGASPTVMRVVPAGANQLTVAPVPVKPGVAAGDQIEVQGDIHAGDRVVVRGNERVRPGMPVQVVQQ